MNILNRIIGHKKEEVARNKQDVPLSRLMQQPFFYRPVFSLKESLLDETKTGIIAEFKRRSPSRGIINSNADVEQVTKAYAEHGASCLSVLTDSEFFGGSAVDFAKARVNNIPVLRKDFIIDEYQVAETRAMGADVILLIAACLTTVEVQDLAIFAKQLQLEVLLEIHDENELDHICDEIDLVGVNNRDLKTFSVDINRSVELGKRVPGDKIKIAESGIRDTGTINIFRDAGFTGFLMGENFMKEKDPGQAFEQFVQQLKQG